MVSHLRSCGACRARLADHDPTAIFALLALEPVPAGLLERVSAGVFAATHPADGSPAEVFADRGFPRAAAVAAAVVLAALLGTVSLRTRPGSPAGPAESVAVAAPRAGVAVLATPGTPQVVDLTVGDTQVVMIFDSRMAL